MITEGYSTSTVQSTAPNLCNTFSFNTAKQGNPMNECANKGTLLCQNSASFPLFHISFAFCAEGNAPQPSRVPSPARGSDDATVAPERVYEKPTMLTRGFEPWSHGAPLHLFLSDALFNTPTRTPIMIEKENLLNYQWMVTRQNGISVYR